MARTVRSDVVKLAIAAGVVAGLAAWTIHGDLAGGSARRAQEILETRANQRLVGVGAPWARVTMRGQRAALHGTAPNEVELLAARGAAREAVWNGGWLLGGITAVDSREARVAAPREGPYVWRAELDEDGLRLTGAAPTREAAADLGALAGALFADRRLVNALQVDPVPPGEGWAEAARGGLAVLSHLETGAAELDDFKLDVAGEAADPEAAVAARAGLERLIGVVSATSRIEVAVAQPAAPPAAEETEDANAASVRTAPVQAAPMRAAPMQAAPEQAAPEPGADSSNAETGEPADAPSAPAQETDAVRTDAGSAGCESELAAALEADGAAIRFDVNSAALAADSAPLLVRLAAIAGACPSVGLRIEGYTDDTGVVALNQSLSERRARAVVDRLVRLGVDPARLSAVGRGASAPVAANDTAEGRRANRRIEIVMER